MSVKRPLNCLFTVFFLLFISMAHCQAAKVFFWLKNSPVEYSADGSANIEFTLMRGKYAARELPDFKVSRCDHVYRNDSEQTATTILAPAIKDGAVKIQVSSPVAAFCKVYLEFTADNTTHTVQTQFMLYGNSCRQTEFDSQNTLTPSPYGFDLGHLIYPPCAGLPLTIHYENNLSDITPVSIIKDGADTSSALSLTSDNKFTYKENIPPPLKKSGKSLTPVTTFVVRGLSSDGKPVCSTLSLSFYNYFSNYKSITGGLILLFVTVLLTSIFFQRQIRRHYHADR